MEQSVAERGRERRSSLAGHHACVDSKLTCLVYVAHDLSGSFFSECSTGALDVRPAPCTDNRRLVGCPIPRSGCGGGGSRDGLDQPAIGVIARQTPRPMEHRQGPLRVFVHPHRDLYIMEAISVLRNLQAPPLIVHRVVLGHTPFFLDTEEIAEPRPNPGHKRRARLLRLDGNARGEGREKLLDQIPVGRSHLGDAGQA